MGSILSNTLMLDRSKTMNIDPQQTLGQALQSMPGGSPSSIPFVVRLVEKPASPMALPGAIDLHRHDCLHILLEKGLSLMDEAFVVGFTMGNDPHTRPFHLKLFKQISSVFYPKLYRFSPEHWNTFEQGVLYGQSVTIKNLNRYDFQSHCNTPLHSLRRLVGIA